MSWGDTPNSNKFKQSYIQGFLDISAGNVIVQRASNIQVKSNAADGSITALQISSTGFDIFSGQSSTFMSYDTFAGLAAIGASFENTVTDISNRLQFIGSTTIGGNKTLIGVSGGSDLEVFGSLSTKSLNGSLGHLFINGDASFNNNVYVTKDLSVNQSLFVTNRSLFRGDVSMSQNLSLTSATQNRSISINKGISSEFALDVSGATLFRSKVSTVADVSINGKLSISDDVSLNKNVTVAGTARFGAPPASAAGYEFDINGQMRIYEATGSDVTSNTSVATLTLEHGNDQGSSSIMFKSPATAINGDYAYIKYQDNSGATTNTGLLTIGIENDPTATATADRISLYAAGGSGYVGVNTLTPTFNLDVSGTTNISNTLTVNKIDASNAASQMDIATTQSGGALNIGTLTTRTGAINIGTGTTSKTIDVGSTSAGTTTIRGGTTLIQASSTLELGNNTGAVTVTLGRDITTGGSIGIASATTSTGGTVNIANGSSSQITTSIGRGDAIKIVNGTSTTVDISAAGTLTLRGGSKIIAVSDVSMNAKLSVQGDTSLNSNVTVRGNISVSNNTIKTIANLDANKKMVFIFSYLIEK
jgi:fibronectin-binding autotransporter adhesin